MLLNKYKQESPENTTSGFIVLASYLDETVIIGEVLRGESISETKAPFKVNLEVEYTVKLLEPIKQTMWLQGRERGATVKVKHRDILKCYSRVKLEVNAS